MDWMRAIDAYCERLGPGLFAEPVNLFSNVVFFAAAFYGYQLALKPDGRRDPGLLILSVIALLVGIGSSLFHSIATYWALMADVAPIAAFIAVAVALALRRLLGLWWLPALFLTAAFLYGIRFYSQELLSAFGSGGRYYPPLVLLVAMGAGLVLARRRGGWPLLAAGGAFWLSLWFRSADRAYCSEIAVGTHFLWHIFNGCVIALVMRAVALQPQRAEPVIGLNRFSAPPPPG